MGAAHIIAGYDNAKKLKTIDKKLDIIISRDSNDLVAQLEAIFESMKERLSEAQSESGRSHLIDLKLGLKELRCRWFRDVTSSLSSMQNPDERGFLAKLFSRRKTTARNVEIELDAQEEPLYLIRFSVNLEYMIAQALGESGCFNNSTLPDIRRQVSELGTLVEQRRDWIASLSGNSKDVATNLSASCQHFEASLNVSAEKHGQALAGEKANGSSTKRSAA